MRKLAIALFAATLMVAPATRADEVTDNMDAARSAYDGGRLAEALKGLNAAREQVATRMNAALREAFPALEGWNIRDDESDGATTAYLGGAMAAREYSRDDGTNMRVTAFVDSQMAEAMAIYLTNPQIAASVGATNENFGGNPAIILPDGTIHIGMTGNRAFIFIEGSASVDDKRNLANNINYGLIAGLQ
ncbi:MAG TPA: hypothetical protein PL096_07475 [Micropepsaceae bacterium]|nr:hypothetical protein [Micropepsaceae bacterium]